MHAGARIFELDADVLSGGACVAMKVLNAGAWRCQKSSAL